MIGISMFLVLIIKEKFVELFNKLNFEVQENTNIFKKFISNTFKGLLLVLLILFCLLVIISILHLNSFYSYRKKLFEHFKNNFSTHSNTPDIETFKHYYCRENTTEVFEDRFTAKINTFCYLEHEFDNFYVEIILFSGFIFTLVLSANYSNHISLCIKEILSKIVVFYFVVTYVYYVYLQYSINRREIEDELPPYQKINVTEIQPVNEVAEQVEIQTQDKQESSFWIDFLAEVLKFLFEILTN
jgi:hypothetical protein